jgi:hypothetical protein
MSRYIFLYRIKDSDDRDVCAYIEPQPRFECGHYFGSVILHGACYSGRDFESYDNIETILTREEYERLIKYSKAIESLGCGIKEGDERYQKGFELYNSVKDVFEKLESDEAIEFFEKIQESEKEWLMEREGLTQDDVNEIWDNYGLDYRDRGIVGCIFNNIRDAAYEEAFNFGYANKDNERWFDFDAFGEDLLDDGYYIELPSGAIAYLNY